MKHTLWKRERERTQQMNLDDFIQANIDDICNDYLDHEPQDWYKINDGDIECVYEWVNSDPSFYTEIMCEIYLNNIIL